MKFLDLEIIINESNRQTVEGKLSFAYSLLHLLYFHLFCLEFHKNLRVTKGTSFRSSSVIEFSSFLALASNFAVANFPYNSLNGATTSFRSSSWKLLHVSDLKDSLPHENWNVLFHAIHQIFQK